MRKISGKIKRKLRNRKKLKKVSNNRYRISVSKSLNNLFVQIIDDKNKKTLVSASSIEKEIKKNKVKKIEKSSLTGEILAKIYGHIWEDLEPTTAKNAGEVLGAAEGELTRSGKEINTINKLFKTVLGIGLEKQDPKAGITYVISQFTDRITSTQTDFIREATNINQLLLDPFLFPKKFEELQQNRYREYSRLYDFITFLKDDLKMTNAEIWAQVKNRKGFSRQTLNLMYQGVFDPANLPPFEYTSIFPGILRRINNTDRYKDNQFCYCS